MTVKETRKRLNLTQAEFASLFDVHVMTVSKWERKVMIPSVYQIELMKLMLSKPSQFISSYLMQNGPVKTLIYLIT